MNNPKISVCVSCYNAEQYVAAFLDSALMQSFDEYEIILADNCSTDGTLKILREYENVFPDKISVYQTDSHGFVGKGRNLTFRKSHGDYIYWCDCDDLMHPKALEKLYNEAVKYDADMVCGLAMIVKEDRNGIISISKYCNRKTMQVSPDIEIKAPTELWFRLLRRSLVEQMGPVPEDAVFDDTKYVTVMKSYASVIRHLDYPIYYFFMRGENSSPSSTLTRTLCAESALDSKYALENCNKKYLEAVQFYVARRTVYGLTGRWQFFDMFLDEVKEYSSWFYGNAQIKSDKRLFNSLRWAESIADRVTPNIVYVDGFTKPPSERRLAELREKVFHDGCEIVTLSPETCDVNENEYIKRAYERGDMALVNSYFALKRIYENGGIFIHENIRVINFFSYLKYQNAFFALLDKTTYSEWIYGASAGNEAIGAILKTYSDAWDKKGEYMPLAERISIILTAKYGIPLDGKGRLFQEVVSVLPPDLSVADTRFGDTAKKCAFEHNFSAYAGEPEYITMPRTSFRVLMTPQASGPAGKSARERALERELADMKATNTYKLMMKIRAIGDGPHGPFLKKIFHWMLRVWKKLKPGGKV